MNRRQFNRTALIGSLGFTTVSTAGQRDEGLAGGLSPQARQRKAYQIRRDAAMFHRDQPLPARATNGDEAIANYAAMFTKTLPHDANGEVDGPAYRALLHAVATGAAADFEKIPMGGTAKLVDPMGAFAYGLEGPDGQLPGTPAPPSFSSAETAAEMVEDYWLAITRDVPFAQYATHPLIQQAADDLSRLSDFRAPKSNRMVTPETVFRGMTPGDLTGPYLSQFLLKPVPYGMTTLEQRYRTAAAGLDFMTAPAEWLNVQRGLAPAGRSAFDDTPRFLRNGRDLASYLHSDFSYQAPLNTGLMLLSYGGAMMGESNPYRAFATQASFVTFGGPQVLDCVARVSAAALRATWCEKWLVHRRIRPEGFAARLHQRLTGGTQYPIHDDALRSAALKTVFAAQGSYLLAQAYPEGAPGHPSYPAGHAALIGAGVTVLKAFFNGAATLPSPVEPSTDGLSLLPYAGPPLTVNGELNKLASNIALGRDTAGVHFRSDGVQGLKLGETVALGILRDIATTMMEKFDGFRITRFDGSEVLIGPGTVM